MWAIINESRHVVVPSLLISRVPFGPQLTHLSAAKAIFRRMARVA